MRQLRDMRKLTRRRITEQLHQSIRNDDDYSDWEYGTEPIDSVVIASCCKQTKP